MTLTLPTPDATAAAEAAITSRRSIRAFLPTPVPRPDIERILEVAARAPSGTNTQPWKVHVLTGVLRQQPVRPHHAPPSTTRPNGPRTPRNTPTTRWSGCRPISTAAAQGGLGPVLAAGHRQGRQTTHARAAPPQLLLLRRAGGPDLHHRPRHAPGQLAGLRHVPAERDGGRARARARHLPAGRLHASSTASSRPSSACPMRHHEMVVCGMSLGYADPAAVENTLVTEREPVAGFARFHG
jgi:hypothetical protein